MPKLRSILLAGLLCCPLAAYASQHIAINNTNSVVPTTTPQLLLQSRVTTGNRQYLEIQNQDATASVYVGTNANGANGLLLKPGQDYSPAVNIPGNAIYVWVASGVTATAVTVGWEG